MSRRQRPGRLDADVVTVVFAVLLVSFAAAGPAGADTLVVTDCGDSVPGGGASGQLRRLINDANPGDLIQVPACLIEISGNGGEDANQYGDLDVTKNLTIMGAGAGLTVLRKSGSGADRVFHVLPGVAATITDLSVSDTNWFTDGAGIFNAGQLTLSRVTLNGNVGINGGAIYNETTGVLIASDCTLSGNHAASGAGGGIDNRGQATLIRSALVQNVASSGGGGIYNPGSLVLIDSTISGSGGGAGVGGGLSTGGATGSGVAEITGSTISGNSVLYGGGGIFNSGTLNMTNSTVSGNTSNGPGGTGGGITNYGLASSVSMSLTRVTVTGNSATAGANNLNNSGSVTATVEGTIITGGCLGGGVNISNGHNLDTSNICFGAPVGTDLQNVADVKLGPLQNNGGRTRTHLPASDSPAVDAGGATCPVAVDQRGVPRPQGAACDIGAAEWSELIFEDGFESGDFSRWWFSATDSGDLTVAPGAALGGTLFGMQGVVDDVNGLFVEDHSPAAETRYLARFYFDPNGFDPGEASAHLRTRLMLLFDEDATRRQSALVLRRRLGDYSLMLRCRRDDDTQYNTGFFPISDDPHWVLIEWRRATTDTSGDGFCSLTIDGTTVATLSDVPNNVATIGRVRMGAMTVKDGANGTLLFDEFVSKRAGTIPPLP